MIGKKTETVLVATLVWFGLGAFSFAQDDPHGPTSSAPVTIGSIKLWPNIDFSSGIDTNVFNSVDQPRSDVVWTLTPKTESTARLGRVMLTGHGSVDFVYFQHLATERSINLSGSVKLAVPLNRVGPFVSASFLRTRERPSFEIDARSLRHERSVSLGTTTRISPKTQVELVTTRSEVEFDADSVFLDTSLRELLNRRTTTIGVSLRHQLTPLTALIMAADGSDERFVFSPVRDARSIHLAPTVEFAPLGRVNGRATVGYRLFNLRDASVPDFKGGVAAVDLVYTLQGDTRFVFKANRDVEYSYEPAAPYYVVTGIGGEISQRVTNRIGVTVRGARYQLRYEHRLPEAAQEIQDTSRLDGVVIYGGGFFHKIGRNLRVNIDLDHYRRLSPVISRVYRGLRGGSSVVYEF
jgi:hypothetical protein